MMKKPSVLPFLILNAASVAAATLPVERLNANGVALCTDRTATTDEDCYDPVSYFTSPAPQKAGSEGSRRFRFKFKTAVYVFSSKAHLDLFKTAPAKYAPQFGGWCAYAVAAKKEKVDIDPESFLIQDGRLLVFFDKFYAHTRHIWLTDKKKTAATYLHEADATWPDLANKE